MKLWVYCICYNEQAIMPYFLRHYAAVADKIIFYDDHSDDGTRALIQAEPKAELRDWTHGERMDDDQFMACFNEQWKEAKGQADWIAWVDADEFLYHPNLRELLEDYAKNNYTVPRVAGYGIVSDKFPSGSGQIWEEIKTGVRSPEWDKHEIFHASVHMRWGVGRHNIDPIGPWQYSPQTDIKLLHYRYLGLPYMEARCQRNFSRQPDRCKRRSYGDNNFPNATKHYSVHWFKNEIMPKTFPDVI